MSTTRTPVQSKTPGRKGSTITRAPAWKPKATIPTRTAFPPPEDTVSEKISYAQALKQGIVKRPSERTLKVLSRETDTFYNGQPIFVIEGTPDFDTPSTQYQANATPCDICAWCRAIDWQKPAPRVIPTRPQANVELFGDFLAKYLDTPLYNSYPRL